MNGDILWAPWRMEFIRGAKSSKDSCIFCELAASGDIDSEKLVLHRGKSSYVLMNRYPYNTGHLLVIPFSHTGTLSSLSSDEHAEIMRLTSASVEILQKVLGAEGFNCGFNLGRSAGAGIADHLHMHVVPRWVGDSNFMPVIGGTRSMPEYLKETYSELVDSFNAL